MFSKERLLRRHTPWPPSNMSATCALGPSKASEWPVQINSKKTVCCAGSSVHRWISSGKIAVSVLVSREPMRACRHRLAVQNEAATKQFTIPAAQLSRFAQTLKVRAATWQAAQEVSLTDARRPNKPSPGTKASRRGTFVEP